MNDVYDIKTIEDNRYPTRDHVRLEFEDKRAKQIYWLYSNQKETKLEVTTPSGSRTYDQNRIPKKYQKVYEQMEQILQK